MLSLVAPESFAYIYFVFFFSNYTGGLVRFLGFPLRFCGYSKSQIPPVSFPFHPGSVVIIVVSAFWVFRRLNILKEFALEKDFYSLDPSNYLYTYVSLLTNMVD